MRPWPVGWNEAPSTTQLAGNTNFTAFRNAFDRANHH